MYKEILISLLICAAAGSTCLAAERDTVTDNTVISGTCTANSTITVLIKDKADGKIKYICETDSTANGYFTKFKLPVSGEYEVCVRRGNDGVSKESINSSARNEKYEVSSDFANDKNANKFFTADETIGVKTKIQNIYGDEGTYNIYVACYDENGVLINVKRSENIAVEYGSDGAIQSSGMSNITIPQNTAYVRIMNWERNNEPISYSRKQSPNDTMYRDGDVVAFCGDSITHIGIYPYFIEHYYQTRFPERNITFFNKGISANTAEDIYNRLDWDVFSEKPNRITLMAGTNDVAWTAYHGTETQEKYKQESINNYRKIIEKCKNADIETVIATKPITDSSTLISSDVGKSAEKNKIENELVAMQKSLAAEYGLKVIDINKMSEEISDYGHGNGASNVIISNDRVHPTDVGSTILGYCFLKEQGASANVSNVVLDENDVQTDNCTVSELSTDANGISFLYSPDSSPIAANANYKKAEEFVPTLTEDINREIICAKGLTGGKYSLILDGNAVGEYSAEELENGVNIATFEGNPNQKRALSAYEKLMKKDAETDKLRAIAYTEEAGRAYDLETDEGWSKFIEDCKNDPNAYFFEQYKQYKPNEESIKTAVKNYTAEAKTLSQPISYQISITAK